MSNRHGKPVAVVLLQLGGPDALSSVEPFLYNLFCDPDIIDLPLAFLFRRRLARMISRKRAPRVMELYRRIGNRSPILKLTLRQARALERTLRDSMDVRVYVGMRYWHPMLEEIIDQVFGDGAGRIILLPLYPQYSKATTGSSVREWKRVAAARSLNHVSVDVIDGYCDHPMYIRALIRNITIALNRVPAADRSRVHLVFSAHGTPMKLVRAGDPYRQQILRTYQAVTSTGNFGLEHHLCFQSKVGPQKWLEPSLLQTVEELARKHVSHVIVVPTAFVTDHIETLSEINMEARHEARRLGIRYFDMSPALNTNPFFISALADLVLRRAQG